MRRKDLTVGEHYATTSGVRYEVVSIEAGKGVLDGRFVDDQRYENRFVAGKGHVPYQTNPRIAVYLVHDNGHKEAQAIEPRILVETWADYEAKQKVTRKTFAEQQRTARALTAAAKKAGLPRMTVDMEHGQAHIKVRDLARHLGVTV